MRKILLPLLIALASAPAFAQSEPSTSTTIPEADRQASMVLVKRAVEAYRAKAFVRAGELFLSAYELSRVANQLRSAAKAFEQGKALPQAEAAWKRFLKDPSLSPNQRSEAQARVELYEERRRAEAAEAKAAAKPPAEPGSGPRAQPPPPTEPSKLEPPPPTTVTTNTMATRRPWVGPLVLGGVGVVAFAASLGLYLSADNRLGDLDDQLAMLDGQGRIVGVNVGIAQQELDGINRDRTIAVAMVGAGGAAAIAGLFWWLFGGEEVLSPTLQTGQKSATVGVIGLF